MHLGLQKKVVLISGASGDLGRVTTLEFAREGANVALFARNPERLQEVAVELEKTGVDYLVLSADVSRLEDHKRVVTETIQKFGRIDILVNSAGIATAGAFLDVPDQQWVDEIHVKLLGTVRLTREAIPHMIQAGGGRIITVIGSAGKEPIPDHLSTGAISGALRSFNKGLALALKQHNILVNAVSPAATDTTLMHAIAQRQAQLQGKSSEEILTDVRRQFVGAHLTKPEEIAAIILFLASERLATLTGSEIDVNGGTVHSL
jgi:3-oxoacyl-[acyl-carrier protein] reductase